MEFNINKDVLNLVTNEGMEIRCTDDVCEKCGCDKFIIRKQTTIFGTQTTLTCKNCKSLKMKK